MPRPKLTRKDLIYPELSYKIIGILFGVFNELGYRYQEKYYQAALRQEFSRLKMPFKEQIRVPITYRDNEIGYLVLDFLIDNKLILEIKRGAGFSSQDISQVNSYLKSTKLKLAILARFSPNGLKFKRIVNLR